jgi:hypothetical protein
MKRLLIIGLMLFSHVDTALAESVSDKVFANLKAQGYVVLQQDRTWLGRIWVLARSKTVQREVVFDPTTGEILRDYAISLADLAAQNQIEFAGDSDDSDQGGVGTVAPPVAVTAGDIGADPVIVATPLVVTGSPEASDAMVGQVSTDLLIVLP